MCLGVTRRSDKSVTKVGPKESSPKPSAGHREARQGCIGHRSPPGTLLIRNAVLYVTLSKALSIDMIQTVRVTATQVQIGFFALVDPRESA